MQYNFEWLLCVMLALIGTITKYFRSLANAKSFTWFACLVESITAVSIGLVLYYLGEAFNIEASLLCTLCVLSGMWGLPFVKHVLRTYTKIPIPD